MGSKGVSHQLPSNIVAKEFGEINVRRIGAELEVSFTILMEPDGDLAEGWQTGVALDASASMKSWYGRGLRGSVPASAEKDYLRRGWMREVHLDGRIVKSFQSAAYEDAINKGYLVRTTNIVEPLAQKFISYLASNLDEDGGTTVIYWACDDGAGYEIMGDFTGKQVQSLKFSGPQDRDFGTGTQLLPAMRYFVDRFRDAKRGMYLFLTDGKIDDLQAVKKYTIKLCHAIDEGRQNMVKCVLIGVGERIDEGQMEELDDLESGTDVDIWDHKIAADMRNVVEIFAEVVDENTIVAPTARILDATGKVVRTFADGLPTKASFTMPVSSKHFILDVGGQLVKQSVVFPR